MQPLYQFRVTKYDPNSRDASGAYLLDEWTSRSDVGNVYRGKELTLAEYQAVEDAYAEVALAFLSEAGVFKMVVQGLENDRSEPLALSEGDVLDLAMAEEVIRGMLQERMWCRLNGIDAFVHVGYDYYMYVGVPSECLSAQSHAQRRGLFVEEIPSPYSENAP